MQVSTTGFVFLQLKKRTVRMKVRAWLVRGLFHGCDAVVSVKGEM